MTNQVKPNFDEVYKVGRQIDHTIGLLLFKSESVTRTWQEKVLLWIGLPVSVPLILTFAFGTLTKANFSLLSILMTSSIFIVFATHYFGIGIIVLHKKEILGFYAWCRKIFDIEKNYHVAQHKRAGVHIRYSQKWSIRIVKWFKIILYTDAFIITCFIAIVGSLLPDNIYPDFLAPLPYVLPFEDNHTWTSFIITVIFQYICALHLTSYSIYIVGLLYIISICILGYLNVIIDTIKMMGQQLQLEFAKKYEENVEVHDEIEFVLNPNASMSIPEWIKLIVDMISDVNEVISGFSGVFSVFFLTIEISCFGALFICGIEVLVVREQLLYAFGVLTAPTFLFILCYINEKILEKFENIKQAMYEIPWYYIGPKERKLLLTALLAETIQSGLSAAGIHGITMERYGKIMQAAYSNVIVLKDLIQSH